MVPEVDLLLQQVKEDLKDTYSSKVYKSWLAQRNYRVPAYLGSSAMETYKWVPREIGFPVLLQWSAMPCLGLCRSQARAAMSRATKDEVPALAELEALFRNNSFRGHRFLGLRKSSGVEDLLDAIRREGSRRGTLARKESSLRREGSTRRELSKAKAPRESSLKNVSS